MRRALVVMFVLLPAVPLVAIVFLARIAWGFVLIGWDIGSDVEQWIKES